MTTTAKTAAPDEPTMVPGPFFALRTPLLPFDELEDWAAGMRAPAELEGDRLAEAWAADRARLRERLRARVALPEVREALFVASPSLEQSLPSWLENPESERGRKAERTLVRYLQRMASRPTPFGLFAGYSLGGVGPSTRLVLAGRDRYQRHTRLDGDYLEALTRALARDPAVRRTLVYRPNSTLYRLAGRLRWVQTTMQGNDGKLRTHNLTAADPSPHLEATLARAAGGARLDQLISPLVDGEITRQEATEFITALVDSQLLVSDLVPLVTGPEPTRELITQLASQPETQPVAQTLEGAQLALARVDAAPLGAAPAQYRSIAASLETLPARASLDRLFQVDLVKPARQAQLGPEVLRELEQGVRLLQRISARPAYTSLSAFCRTFAARHEGQELALVQLLDEEEGLGFGGPGDPGPLLEGLRFPGAPVHDEQAVWNAGQQHLLRRLEQALRSGSQEVVLEEHELGQLERQDQPRLPHSFTVTAELSAASEQALEQGEFRILIWNASGPPGAKHFGRFCHGDEQLRGQVLDHLREEEAQRPEAIFAEVVHQPHGRLGNVILRPLLRQYEIPYLGRSGAPAERQIPVEDLLVSMRGERIVLRSRRLGREIIPRLTNMHNFSHAGNLPVYRFLCSLARQGSDLVYFSWGVLRHASFLPRLRAGRVVLSLATWRLYPEELRPLADSRGVERWRRVQSLRRARTLPRWVALVEDENQFPIDLDNALSVDAMVDMVAGRNWVWLSEVFGVDGLCVQGPEGRFRNELMVPFTRRQAPEAPEAPSPAVSVARAPRRRGVGSEWLYLKLYTGPANVDGALVTLGPALATALASGAADSWFFIRYNDPDWHLRLRVHGDPARLCAEVLPALAALAQQLIDADRAHKLLLDSYEQEIGRYGGDHGMLLAERLFWADSEAVLGILELLSGQEGAQARWRLALCGMDRLLDDLGFAFEQKQAIVRGCRDRFAREHRAEGMLARQIADKFRSERASLEPLLDPLGAAGSPLAPGLDLFRRRSRKLRPIGERLRAAEAAGRLTVPMPDLAASYLHMHANRMLRSAARAQELVIYDFLERLYQGLAARRRQEQVEQGPIAGGAHG